MGIQSLKALGSRLRGNDTDERIGVSLSVAISRGVNLAPCISFRVHYAAFRDLGECMRAFAFRFLIVGQALSLAVVATGCADMARIRAAQLAKIKHVQVVADLQRTEIPVQRQSLFSSTNESAKQSGPSGAVANLLVAQTRRDLDHLVEDNHALVLQTVNDPIAGFDKLESFVQSMRSGFDATRTGLVSDVGGQWKLSKTERQRIVSSTVDSAVMFVQVDQIMSQDGRVFEVGAAAKLFYSGARANEAPEIECNFVYQSALQPGMDSWAVNGGALIRQEWANAAAAFAGMVERCVSDARGGGMDRKQVEAVGYSSTESMQRISGALAAETADRYVVQSSTSTYYSLPKSNSVPNEPGPAITRVGR